MYKFAFALIALSVSLFGTQSFAQCSGEGGFVSCDFSSGQTTNTYEFGNDGRLIVEFDAVVRPFTLNVTVNHTRTHPIDFTVFPSGTDCVKYSNTGNTCVEYDFSGTGGGPNGVPVKNVDYKRMITLTLSYFVGQTVHTPAFGHAPGDTSTAVYNEDILTAYSSSPEFTDPTMVGKVPGLSSVIALDEPLVESDVICNVTLSPPLTPPIIPGNPGTYSASSVKEFELSFKLFSGSCGNGAPLRDKTAQLSLTYSDGNNIIFPPMTDREEGNKFHWESKPGLNEFDISTVGLPTGVTYTITIFSRKASPAEISFTLIN